MQQIRAEEEEPNRSSDPQVIHRENSPNRNVNLGQNNNQQEAGKGKKGTKGKGKGQQKGGKKPPQQQKSSMPQTPQPPPSAPDPGSSAYYEQFKNNGTETFEEELPSSVPSQNLPNQSQNTNLAAGAENYNTFNIGNGNGGKRAKAKQVLNQKIKPFFEDFTNHVGDVVDNCIPGSKSSRWEKQMLVGGIFIALFSITVGVFSCGKHGCCVKHDTVQKIPEDAYQHSTKLHSWIGETTVEEKLILGDDYDEVSCCEQFKRKFKVWWGRGLENRLLVTIVPGSICLASCVGCICMCTNKDPRDNPSGCCDWSCKCDTCGCGDTVADPGPRGQVDSSSGGKAKPTVPKNRTPPPSNALPSNFTGQVWCPSECIPETCTGLGCFTNDGRTLFLKWRNSSGAFLAPFQHSGGNNYVVQTMSTHFYSSSSFWNVMVSSTAVQWSWRSTYYSSSAAPANYWTTHLKRFYHSSPFDPLHFLELETSKMKQHQQLTALGVTGLPPAEFQTVHFQPANDTTGEARLNYFQLDTSSGTRWYYTRWHSRGFFPIRNNDGSIRQPAAQRVVASGGATSPVIAAAVPQRPVNIGSHASLNSFADYDPGMEPTVPRQRKQNWVRALAGSASLVISYLGGGFVRFTNFFNRLMQRRAPAAVTPPPPIAIPVAIPILTGVPVTVVPMGVLVSGDQKNGTPSAYDYPPDAVVQHQQIICFFFFLHKKLRGQIFEAFYFFFSFFESRLVIIPKILRRNRLIMLLMLILSEYRMQPCKAAKITLEIPPTVLGQRHLPWEQQLEHHDSNFLASNPTVRLLSTRMPGLRPVGKFWTDI